MREALASLYETHRAAWVREAKQARAGCNAEDAVHDAVVLALEQLDQLSSPKELEPLIARLIRRCATRVRIQDMRRGMILERAAHAPVTPTLTALERDLVVRSAVEHLQGVSPELVWRGLAQGETCRELARTNHCDPMTISRRLRRAKVQLIGALAHYGKNRRGCATKEPSHVLIG